MPKPVHVHAGVFITPLQQCLRTRNVVHASQYSLGKQRRSSEEVRVSSPPVNMKYTFVYSVHKGIRKVYIGFHSSLHASLN